MLTTYSVYKFSVDYLEEKFQNYHVSASYQDYTLQTMETYSGTLKQKEGWLEGYGWLTTSKEAQGPGLRKSKNLGSF